MAYGPLPIVDATFLLLCICRLVPSNVLCYALQDYKRRGFAVIARK